MRKIDWQKMDRKRAFSLVFGLFKGSSAWIVGRTKTTTALTTTHPDRQTGGRARTTTFVMANT